MSAVLSVVDREYTPDMDQLIRGYVSSGYTTIIPNSNISSYIISEKIFKSIPGVKLTIYIPAAFNSTTKRFVKSISGRVMNIDSLADFRNMISQADKRITLIQCDDMLDAQTRIMGQYNNFLMFGPVDNNVNYELMKLASDRTRNIRLTHM